MQGQYMQAKVVRAAGDTGFNALVYQQPSANVMEYLQGTISNASTQLGDAGNDFVAMSNSSFNKYNSDQVIMAAKSIASQVDSHINPDVIISYNESNIYNATPVMRSYIMLQPDLFELNKSQQCSAFDNLYYDEDPTAKTVEDHSAYNRVMDGILTFDKNGDGNICSYSDGSDNEDLHFIDQLSIINTWNTVTNLIATGMDPSSFDGDEL